MLFFPYAVIARLNGIPFFTFVIASLCFLAFFLQIYSDRTFVWGVDHYCEQEVSAAAEPVFEHLYTSASISCKAYFFDLSQAALPNEAIKDLAKTYELSQDQQNILTNEFTRFEAIVPQHLTIELWYDPEAPKVHTYFTSSLLHADIYHLAFNLIFFFAFAIAAEQILGNIAFLLMAVVCSVVTKISYQYGFLAPAGTLPTIGLSGFVTCTMAFVAVIHPNKWVSIFYLIVLFAGRFRLPVLLVVGFYIGSDIYALAYLTGENNINYVAHLSGAATGAAFAILYLSFTSVLKFLKSKQN